MPRARIFGDPAGFAIRCAYSEESTPDLAYCCHWLLGGKLIGDAQEPCYLPAWTAALRHFKLHLLPKLLASPSRPDEAATLRFFAAPHEEWTEEAASFWNTHRINLDETQDAWLLMTYLHKGKITFIWQGWRAPCPAEEIGLTFTTSADYTLVVQAIDDCLRYVGHE